MQRLADHTKALHGGSSWTVDSTVRSEFGWGSHTAHTAIVTYQDIHSHATVYVAEDRILIILSSDPDFGSSYADARNEDKFVIELADITDVVIKREPSIVGRLHKAKKEVRRQSIFIHLKGGEACVVDTYDSDFSAKVVMMTWHTNIVRRSAGLGTLLNSEDHDVAAAFHQETITCLQTATRHSEVVDILEDFAKEVLTDLELKDITFRSRELIINCLQLLENLVTLPAIQQRERGRHTEILPVHANDARLDAENKKLAQSAVNNVRTFAERKKKNTSSTASLAFSDTSEYESEPMSVEQEHKMKVIAVDRMKLIFCILKMFSSLLFSSESLSSRFALLLGPSPLDLESWIKIFIPDTYKLVCRALGCPDTTTTAQIEAEIALSLQADRTSRSRLNTHRAGEESATETAAHSVSSTPRKSISVADSMLTPLSARLRTMAESQAPDDYAEAMHQLGSLKQAIRDLQGMLMFDVHRIFSLAKALVKANHQNNDLNAQLGVIVGQPVAEGLLELKQINCLGDLYVRERHWEESLEDIVTRISALLQDMASSPHITSGVTSALNTSGGMSNSNSLNSLHGHHNMRLNFSMVSNSHTFSAGSLPGIHAGSFISPMVPPSPRSPLASARGTMARPTSRPRVSSAPMPMIGTPLPHVPSLPSSAVNEIRAALKPPFVRKGYFFGSGNNINAHGIADAEAEPAEKMLVPITAPLRTQEIMLFYLATLLRTLAIDTYKIREVMQTDLVSYWRNIIGMLNILCPRPDQEEDSVVENHVSSSAKVNSSLSSFALGGTPASPAKTPTRKRKAKKAAAEEAPDTADSSTGSRFVKRFLGMFTSRAAEEAPVGADEIDNSNKKNQKMESGSVLAELGHTAFFDQRTEQEMEVKIPALYVFDYGKPRYGMSHAAWTLLVLTRCAIEDIILRLKIDPKIILTKQNIKIDDKLLRDLGSQMGINGGIAEVDSEDEYSVSHVESENSLDLGVEGSSISTPVPQVAEEAKLPTTGTAGEVRERSSSGVSMFPPRRASKSITGGLQIQVPGDEPPRNRTESPNLPQRTMSPMLPFQR